MKALVISDDAKTLEFVDDVLSKNGIDSINYKWLIKALDNVEEINPDLIIVNVLDYPRHWKTLAQFVKTIFSNKISICLFVPEGFSGGEMKKARTLEIDFCCHSQEEFEKCMHNFAQKKRISLQNLKKIYSEKDDSTIISVTDLLQLLGKPFINETDDIKLYSAFELFNKLEGISKKSEKEPLEKSNCPKKNAVPVENSAQSENDKAAEYADADDTEKNTESRASSAQSPDVASNAGEGQNVANKNESEIEKTEDERASDRASVENTNANGDDYILPTVKTLFKASKCDYVLPTAENLFGKEVNDYTLPTVENLFANSKCDYVLPTAESLFAEENSTESKSIESAENTDEPIATAGETDTSSSERTDCTLPTVENLFANSKCDYVLPTAESLFAEENPTENTSDGVSNAEESTGISDSASEQAASGESDHDDKESPQEIDDFPLPSTKDSIETPLEVEQNKAIETNDDYTLPTVENVLENSRDECVLPSAESLFEESEASYSENKGEPVSSDEPVETADASVAIESETNAANESAAPLEEATTANKTASDESVESADSEEKPTETIKEPLSENATAIRVEAPIEKNAPFEDKNESHSECDFDTAEPLDKNNALMHDASSASDDSKTHFGSLFRLIQEKYEGK